MSSFQGFPSEGRNRARFEGERQDEERAEHHRETEEAKEVLRESGHMKQPWYRRWFRKTPEAPAS